MKSLTPYVTKKDKDSYKTLKNTLLDTIEGVFDDLGINIKSKTRNALEHMCFRSMEQGFVHTSPAYLESEFGVGKSTIYANLRVLLDAGVLCKKNFSSKKHNGLGAGIYFFTAHPYFEHISDYLNLNWKANEKANEKAEIAENPCVESDSSDFSSPTLCLPSLDLSTKSSKDIDLQSTVPATLSTSNVKSFVKYVPKEINNKAYVGIFGFRLRNIWVKIKQAWDTINQSALDKADLITIGDKIYRRILEIWREKQRNNRTMTVDEMCAFAYKSARETIYNTLAAMHMEDYDSEENTLMGEAVRAIPVYEEICMRVNPEYGYEEIKKHVSGCLEWGFLTLSSESLRRILDNYELYSNVQNPTRLAMSA